MSKLQDHSIAEARRMREAGHSWGMIGRMFGVNPDTVMCAIDPIYAERRRQQLRDSRARVGRKPAKRPEIAIAKIMPAMKRGKVWALQSAIGRELGIKAITIRTISASHPVGKSARWQSVPVSLPYLSFLYGEAR